MSKLSTPVRAQERVEAAPHGRGAIGDIAIAPDGQSLMVANFGDSTISLVDTKTASAVANVPLGGEPVALAAGPHRVFAAYSAWSYDAIAVIDTDTTEVIADHRVALSVRALAASPDGRRLYIGRQGPDGADVAIMDAVTGDVRIVDVAADNRESVDAVRASADGRRLYIALSTTFDGTLIVLDIRRTRVLRRLRLGAPIRDLAITPDGRVGCVLTCDPVVGGAVHMLDATNDRLIAPLQIGGFPSQLAVSPDGSRAYIVDRDRVDVLCTRSAEIVETIPAADQPSCVAMHTHGVRVYIAEYAGALAVRAAMPALPEPAALPAPARLHDIDLLCRRELEAVAV